MSLRLSHAVGPLVRACNSSPMTSSLMPKRGLHRATDKDYLDVWKKFGVDFREMTRPGFYKSPILVENVLRVMTVAKLKGECTFVSAFPASSKVLMKMYEGIYPKNSETNPWFKYLRSPKGLSSKMTLEEAKSSIPTRVMDPKTFLLSQSYGLMSGIKSLESAHSWGFINHFGKEQYPEMAFNLRCFFEEIGLDRDVEPISHLRAKGDSLIRKYNRLKIGDLYVLTFPWEKVDRYVYDCKPFNIPTGKRASDIARDPTRHIDGLLRESTHMATMLLCEETLHPQSGLSAIAANDPAEVDAFCAGYSYTPMKNIEVYRSLVSPVPTAFEAEQMAKRKEYDQQLMQLVQQMREYLDTGKVDDSLFKEEAEPVLPCDLPQRLL